MTYPHCKRAMLGLTVATVLSGAAMAAPDAAFQNVFRARIDRRVSTLHTNSRITPEQEPAWSGCAAVMRENARKMDDSVRDRARIELSMTALDFMRSCAQFSMRHAADMRNLVPAFETLYRATTEPRKHTADQVFRDEAGKIARSGNNRDGKS